jgi:pectate lyase
MSLRKTHIALLAAAVGLFACGGGDDAAAPAPAPSPAPAPAPAPAPTPAAPSSLGADGWATVNPDGTAFVVTGGHAADAAHTYVVTNRAQLIAALYGSASADPATATPDDTPKRILISGTVDLNVSDTNVPMTAEHYMAACTTPYTSAAAFWADYKATYAPQAWLQQSLESDNKPPALPTTTAGGALTLEGQRDCFSKAQARRIVLRVGSNTSLLGIGNDAKIVRGNLRLGDVAVSSSRDANGYAILSRHMPARNIVIRNIAFEDSYDFFPAWDPKDSFSITSSEFGTGLCARTYSAANDTGPHQCPSRKGGRWNSEYDLISVLNATQVWIDHNRFSDGDRPDRLDPPVPEWGAPFNEREQKVQHHDGAVDVTMLASQVTLSYNHFVNHDKSNLLGGTDTAAAYSDGTHIVARSGPDKLAVTMHHNHFENSVQRQPRARFGKVHVYNNLYQGTLKPVDTSLPAPDYAWSVAWTIGTASKLYVEANALEVAPGAVGDTLPSAARLTFGDSLSSSVSNRSRCTAAAPGPAYAAADCETYFFAGSTLLNGTLVPEGSLLTAAQAKASSSTVAVRLLDAGYWVPSASYGYTAQPVADVKTNVLNNAGTGRL